ncbi:EAL domain-containing protein [Oceanobacillus chungangensis]|uniref:EAL domain-containing protein n=1 Tax=Oceanobacillus chungangensis TaxID=1229152 RepID=A0A3D8PTD6_9BACI|nr:EAL domain-containing protein [Oceanobacillus chungangensis]RDW19403.1 EAL domain-containing protein [Oceanobacillus chungangensis]
MMYRNSTLNFIRFLKSNWNSIYQEFKKSEEVQRVLKSKKITTVFQPIVSLQDGSTIGFEVLNRPESTNQFPTTDTFYDYVASSNYVFQVERCIREVAFEKYREQVNTNLEYINQLVFLNIQPQVLTDRNYQSGITLELLAKHNLSPSQIVLEITEKEAINNYNQFERVIENYREQGFRIAVDDAGTGYNSLQTLVHLKPEFIKIDRSLIRQIESHSEKRNIVELLVEFACKTNTKVIAEGIESSSELACIKQLGIHMGQGYALGKPKPTLRKGTLPIKAGLASMVFK